MLSGFTPKPVNPQNTRNHLFTPQSLKLKQAPLIQLHPQEIITKPIELRAYQKEAIEEFLKRKKGTICHATALGKTFVAMEAIRRIGTPVAVFVPTIAIMEQVWLRRLKQAGWKNVGVYYGGKHELRPITIFLYQSAIRHPEAVATLNPKLTVWDECHHAHEAWAKLLIFAKKAEYSLGLTATISSREPKNKPIIDVMPIIHTMTIGEARKEGWVAPIEVHSAPASMTVEERVKYEDYSEVIRKVAWQLHTTDPTYWAKLAARGDPTARRGLWAISKRRMLLSDVKDKLNVLLQIIRKHSDSQVLLFSESIHSVETAKQFLLQNGIKSETYHSKKPKQQRVAILKAWEKRYFNILLSVTSLEEGLDVPDASVGILYASGKSPRKLVQRVGRLIRKAPGKIARIYVIHVPNTVEWQVLTGVQQAVRKVK
jgi:superfamily II DNA or RNA helicase